jgi:hypothetical protein
MASSSIKLSTDYFNVQRELTSDVNARTSDCETVNNEDEEDDVQTETHSYTRSGRSKPQTHKKKRVRLRRVSANIAATKYDVGKYHNEKCLNIIA